MSCASIETSFNDGNDCNRRIDDLMDGAERLPLLDPKRIAAYREIEDLVVNQDAAMIGAGYGVAVRLGKEYVHDDFPNGIYGGWLFLETAWMEKR
jgi:hypothetical protein